MITVKREDTASVILEATQSPVKKKKNTGTMQTVWSDWSEQVVGRGSLFSSRLK